MQRLIFVVAISFFISSCKPKDIEPEYAATDVLITIKKEFGIEKVFEFVNSQEHTFGEIWYPLYISALPVDSLLYVRSYINGKPYTNNGVNLYSGVWVNEGTKEITIYPILYDIKNTSYQADWIESMKVLKCKETSARKHLVAHVPDGKEKEWVERFKKNPIVENASLNWINDIILPQ